MLKKIVAVIKDFFISILQSRVFVLAAVMLVLFLIVVNRLFDLQIINGSDYLDNFTLTIKKERTLESTRGCIYDKDGELLSYNKLSYDVTIEDSGTYESTSQKNKVLNSTIYELIELIEKNNDSIVNNFDIKINSKGEFEFLVSDASLDRFRADVYGYKSVDELGYNKKLGYDEAKATAKQIFEYLSGENKYDISDEYTNEEALKILVVRYALSQNDYQKYITTTVAEQVSDKTVACVMENIDDLQGVDISEDTVRKYVDSKYFASIIGYTGKISETEIDELNKDTNANYDLTDIVGKAGIEQEMELYLQGSKGLETLYVDNLGKVIETAEHIDSVSGNDVYLTIDKDLQETVYNVLEEQLAGIIYNKIINQKNYTITSSTRASDILIPIDDVYFALINNNIIDIDHFESKKASENEQDVYAAFESAQDSTINEISRMLTGDSPAAYNSCSSEIQAYCDYIQSVLSSAKVLDQSDFTSGDETYDEWTAGNISLKEYLEYAVSKNCIDTTKFDIESKYSDSAEIYNELVNYITATVLTDDGFTKLIYKYMIANSTISGTQLCLILFDQAVLKENTEDINALSSGAISGYTFMRQKIKNLEITPGQLALDPCSASCVVTDVNTGEVRALVSYPGYDNNKLANTVDADYYSKLTNDLSLPLYNHATQEQTAPGSTFKMVSATAGLTEGVISPSETIEDLVEFTKISLPYPKCWKAPSSHGAINVSEAIRDSCNYFFYEVGYRLSINGPDYNSEQGLNRLAKYAAMYGLNAKSGVEIVESEPKISDSDSVRSAIGQGTNNYSTVQLARYVTAVANSGTCYNLSLLDRVQDTEGALIKDFTPSVYNSLDDVADSTWNEVHAGMRMVVQNLDAFDNVTTETAGKTGTAEEVETRGNHALYVGYAPYNSPEIAYAVRIAYGYSSGNAAEIGSKVVRSYFKEDGYKDLVTGNAADTSNQVVGD